MHIFPQAIKCKAVGTLPKSHPWCSLWACALARVPSTCLAFALIKNLFWIGAIAVYAMALGTAVTISLMTMAVVGGRELALVSTAGNHRGVSLVYDLCAFGGAIVIILFGSLLLASSTGPVSPF